MSLLFSRLQENVTTIFCNCNPDPDIDFIYSSVRQLLLFLYISIKVPVSKKPSLAVCLKYLNRALWHDLRCTLVTL